MDLGSPQQGTWEHSRRRCVWQSCGYSHVAVSEPKMSLQPGEREATTLFKGSSVISDRVVIINIGEKPPTDS